MIDFDSEYFQRITFSKKQLDQYIQSAERDLAIAGQTDIAEVIFKFSYDALIKTGIALIAKEGYKTRSKIGHHVKILEKLSQILEDDNVLVLGNKMRQDRNIDLYSGGGHVSQKESIEYLGFVKDVFEKARQKIT